MSRRAIYHPPVMMGCSALETKREPPSRPSLGEWATQSLFVMNLGIARRRWATAS